MKLFNSLTKKIEELKPLKSGEVGLYTCGPTVYDHVHIGNLRTYIVEDVLRATLKMNGLKVKHVMNVTDIEDKIIARAHESGTSFKDITTKFELIFLGEVNKVGIDLSVSKLVRATDEIEAMQELIRKIPNKYVVKDGVYFNIKDYQDYGRFVKLDRSHEHHRINNDEYDKDHVADFALWKTKKDDEPSWPFELEGQNVEGRPGWHIECSAMATKYLGQPFDIHTGGVDLKFPHHENEIAQSKAASNQELANLWLHTEHLLVDGKKMSKSLKNFYTLTDLVKNGFDPIAFRLLVLQAHYRSQLNFSWESLEAAQNRLKHWQAVADLRWQVKEAIIELDVKAMLASLSNDLDTPKTLSIIDEYFDNIEKQQTAPAVNSLELIRDLLGINLIDVDVSAGIKSLIEARETARQGKDWGKADQIRQQLEQEAIGVRDTDHGPIWYRL